MSQWCTRRGNVATPWMNMNDSCGNETRSCQDDAFWYIKRSYKWSCWELEQNKNKFLLWPPRLCIFRIACGYLLHSLIFPYSLLIFKDFGTQIMNTAVSIKIFIFQKWVLFLSGFGGDKSIQIYNRVTNFFENGPTHMARQSGLAVTPNERTNQSCGACIIVHNLNSSAQQYHQKTGTNH